MPRAARNARNVAAGRTAEQRSDGRSQADSKRELRKQTSTPVASAQRAHRRSVKTVRTEGLQCANEPSGIAAYPSTAHSVLAV
jgi:hypothetical protein